MELGSCSLSVVVYSESVIFLYVFLKTFFWYIGKLQKVNTHHYKKQRSGNEVINTILNRMLPGEIKAKRVAVFPYYFGV